MNIKNYFLFILVTLSIFSCNTKTLETVDHVDLTRYSGNWYEIASFPTSFQKGCSCTRAEYHLHESGKYIQVYNSCKRKGKHAGILGKAFVQENSGNAKLRVQFFWPFRGDYYIIALDPDYHYAMVGSPDRDYLWILCRETVLEEQVLSELVQKADQLGFDTGKLKFTSHDCNSED